MLNEAERAVLADYKNAATLNQAQVADYFRLLEKEKVVPEPVEEPKKKVFKRK